MITFLALVGLGAVTVAVTWVVAEIACDIILR